MSIRSSLLAVILAYVMLVPAALGQQGGTTFYVYDANGRVHVVVSPTGDAAIYNYDPAGNITSIQRTTPDTLALYGLTPTAGGPGTPISFFGSGFSAGVSSVSFNGAAAPILSVNANSIVATVPANATTGPVTIVTAKGTLTSAPFTVLAGVLVQPSSTIVLINQTFQFSVFDTVAGDTGVTWGVNGIAGGSATVGTITSGGLYTAPGAAMANVTIQATSILQPSAFGQAQVRVRDPNNLGTVFSQGVSISRGLPITEYAPGQAVSVTTGPVVSAFNPSTLTRGTTTTVTITGVNLGGASDVWFFNTNGTQDTSISIAGISVSADGTSLTVAITVPSGDSAGSRVVEIATPVGASSRQASSLNTIQIQ
jgi:YD repeat-containing protein